MLRIPAHFANIGAAMTKAVLIAFCLLCGPAFAGGTAEWQSYAAKLQEYCPVKHLEFLSPTAFSRIADRYQKGVNHNDRALFDRALQREARDCAVSTDTSCRNEAFLRAIDSINGMESFATAVCGEQRQCIGPGDCHTVSTKQIIVQMAQSLALRGSRATLKEYFDCLVGDGYAAVETGDLRAIKVAVEVRRVSDACVSEGLESSLGTAMQTNPEAVLPYVDEFGTGICEPWMIEEPEAEVLAETAKTKRALLRVTRKDLLAARDKCLAYFAQNDASSRP